ncbi:uncharacterized protein SCODWIG_00038 [Saccharomycodes ludwigii]|uniref:Uncharacterized protein n=1 Tax=Saccharomycodes ludwigii TaxID=36035 RepID=A0A376B0S9_9ASCO|nr:hypothetical protein SCDLUD_001698 [Saccharomycodes ludwigii]KAH3901914.1 hypothetical protein SCDLUD_001698 [Saccharomycodes ludwigii]SSD58277.1 uncharacterized protein SCODWIG_00038 [Saccharomycodes ludwigii]
MTTASSANISDKVIYNRPIKYTDDDGSLVHDYRIPRLPTNYKKVYDNEEDFINNLGCIKLAKEQDLDLAMITLGVADTIKCLESVRGRPTQTQYDLFLDNNLTPDTLVHNSEGEVTKKNSGIKHLVLKNRYELKRIDDGSADGKLALIETKTNLEYLPPKYLFDALMQSHLLNHHLSADGMYRYLRKYYSNASRDICRRARNFCSKCNPSLKLGPFKRPRFKASSNLLPFERIHMEVFKIFNDKKNKHGTVEDKYKYVLYFRDYRSRYVWVYPLEDITLGEILQPLKSFLLISCYNVPIYIESTTIEFQFLEDLVKHTCEMYGLKVGCGGGDLKNFHKSGIKKFKELLKGEKEACLNDWGHILMLVHQYNIKYLETVNGSPKKVLLEVSTKNSSGSRNEQYDNKKKRILDALPANCIEKFSGTTGMYYKEPDGTMIAYDEEENDFVGVGESTMLYYSPPEQDINSERTDGTANEIVNSNDINDDESQAPSKKKRR